MRPGPNTLMRRRPGGFGLWTATLATLLLALLAAPRPAAAQAAEGDATAQVDQERPIQFEADRVEYDNKSNDVTAKGNVVLRRNGQSLRSDSVRWNRKTGVIAARGNVRMVDEDGNQLFTDSVELTDELKAGAMEGMLLVLREGGRMAANGGTRDEQGNIVLDHAAYSPCEVEDSKGCPKKPTWRITARQATYNPNTHTVRLRGARIEIFGIRLMPLPGLSLATDGRAISGLLIPNFRFTPSNGLEVSEAYYQRLSNNRDIAATAYVYTKAAPMASLQYRALTGKGAYQITGYATDSDVIPIEGVTPTSQKEFRGYIFANGKFQLSPEWSVTASIRRATDRTFLRRYEISRDDRLRSMVEVERIDANSYLSIAGWATQTMRVADNQGQVPVALPAIDYRRRFAMPGIGGRVELQFNSLAILRSAGQDSQRAFAGARWDLRRITGMGQEVTLTGLLRGDVYHSSSNGLTSTEIYRGLPGWQYRGVATAALDVKWPLVGNLFGGTQVLTPRVQVVASPAVKNLAVPNEDARAIELEDSNLFALNRFPGYDRIEDGVRFTYGFDWQFEAPRWRIKTTVGQSFRLTSKPTLLPDGTGLSDRASDIVGRTEVAYRNFVKFTYRFRLDKDNFTLRRNEIDLTIGDQRNYIEAGYLKLNRDIDSSIEDLRDREEVRVAARAAFARYWSLFGSAVVNLTNKTEDPTQSSDGFQPLRTRVGVAYQDDCLDLSLTWRRDYVTTGDAKLGNTFEVHIGLRNLGFR
ncbi:MAG: LPS-assembly protein LptD [Novosphingobium sp.]